MANDFITNLAAMMYYDEKGLDPKRSFDKIAEDERKPYIARAQKVLVFMDKMNLEPAKKQDPAKVAENEVRLEDERVRVIRALVRGLDRPKDVAKFFPCEELAKRIGQIR